MVDANKTYLGVVVDNNDPERRGRVKVRVVDVFDNIKEEDIPWASPWKDLNGNTFNIPEINKIVIVVFDCGDIYKPEYIYAEHYNKNLEEKLKKLDERSYKSMKALLFDHKTQIYVNDDEGLKIDYKYNNINITDGSININLKDNMGSVNIGDSTANQPIILGENWFRWFDMFVDILMSNMAFLSTPAGIVKNNVMLDQCLITYKALRYTKFLSQHVNVVDNNMISTVRMEDRVNINKAGDEFESIDKSYINNKPNNFTEDDFSPKEGPKMDYDDSYVPPPTDGSPDDVPGDSVIPKHEPLSSIESNKTISKLVRFMKSKNYIVYDKPCVLNIVGMRNKDVGVVTNRFDDTLYVFFKNKNGNWELFTYDITTTPGYMPKTNKLKVGVAILKLGQYVDQYKLGFHQNKPDHKCLKFAESIIHRNTREDKYDYNSPTTRGRFGINIHRSSPTGSSEFVYNWSEGCQVFKNINQYKQFIKLCEMQVEYAKKETFTYTLCRKSEFDDFE